MSQSHEKYRNPAGLRLVLDAEIERELHEAFAAVTDGEGNVPSEAYSDIRRHRQHPWRFMLRRFREAARQGAKREQLKRIVRVMDRAVDELYPHNAA